MEKLGDFIRRSRVSGHHRIRQGNPLGHALIESRSGAGTIRASSLFGCVNEFRFLIAFRRRGTQRS